MNATSAIAEVAAVARALAALPSARGTAAEIVAASGLDAGMVGRRLRAGSLHGANNPKAFESVRPGERPATWALTRYGLELAKGG